MRIKEILAEKGMTITDLANKLGISRQALHRQISGKLLVSTAEHIAEALNVPMWSLFASKEEILKEEASKKYRCPKCGTTMLLGD